MSTLTWVDSDGDRFRIEAIDMQSAPGVLALISLVDGEDVRDNEVFVTEESAERLIEWLEARLSERRTPK